MLRRADVGRVRQLRRGGRARRDLLPGCGRAGPPPWSATGSLRAAWHKSAARSGLQGGGAMKVAIIAPLVTPISEPQRGGSQAFLSDLARGLAGRGHEVDVYAASGSEVPGVKVIDTGVDPASLSATLYRAPGAATRDPAEAASDPAEAASDPAEAASDPAEAASDPAAAARDSA